MEYLKEFMVIYTIFLMGAVSPGPDFIMIVRNSTGFGSKIGFKTALGISIGCLITLSYILVGVGVVFKFLWFRCWVFRVLGGWLAGFCVFLKGLGLEV